jgi:hypothetical protein
MAGFREFVTGEVLTAANVNDFLAKQAVMKFADAAARDAALGTAVVSPNALREGMVAYLDDEDAPSFYDGSAWGPISVPLAGIGSNVVQTVKTDTFSTTAAGYTAVTGLTVTITPTSSSSKVLVTGRVTINNTTGANTGVLAYRLMRGVTEVGSGTAVGNRVAAGASGNSGELSAFANMTLPIEFLDAPASATAVTYAIEVYRSAGTTRVNTTYDDGDLADRPRTSSVLTAIEVAA